MNKVILIGRLVADPIIYNSKNLTKYARTRIAVSRENNQEETDFISLVAFSHTALFVSTYFSKGDLVAIEGNISSTNYKNDKGEFVDSTNVVIQKIRSLEPREVTNKRREGRGLETSSNPSSQNEFAQPSFSQPQIEEKPKNSEDDNDSPWELDLD